MQNVIKIILSILAALLMFLAGWLAHAWKNRDKVAKEVKKAISDLNKEHKKALESLKKNYDEQLKKKDEIISELKKIIDRLIRILESQEGPGVAKIINNLNTNKERLYKL